MSYREKFVTGRREEILAYCRKKKYSEAYTNYWLQHVYCEARTGFPSAAPHHIRTRGAGGDDSPENLLALSRVKHTEIGIIGSLEFAEAHPWLEEKILKALEAPWGGHPCGHF